MKKWNMIVDGSRCHNCYNCFVATKDEYVDNEYPGYTAPQPLHGHNWVDIERTESGQWPMVEAHYRPVMCNHCDDAPCMKAASGDAIKKRDDGIVIIDPEKSRGQREIVDACPYGAIYWNDELQIPQAWPFDAHLLDRGWDETKLEKACPTGVFRSVKVTDSEMTKIAEQENLKTLEPRQGAKPRVYYKNSHLFETFFLGGTVVTENSGTEDCAEGALVIAYKGDQELARTESDGFGEFKIAGFEKTVGAISLSVEFRGATKTLAVDVSESTYLGCIEI
jgi:Fe-S-cluster-containing dehydrogenase component